MKERIIVALALAAVVAAAAAALLKPGSAPEVRFASLSGETFSTSDLRGKVVLVNFWATYCGTCMTEMPEMVQAYRELAPHGLEIVAVALRQDDRARVAEVAKDLPFKVAYDDSGDAARQFGNVRITPTSFLIDREGKVVGRFVGRLDAGAVRLLVGVVGGAHQRAHRRVPESHLRSLAFKH
jgi:thiol-disulfide isomerase/thioredoxin